MCWAFERNEYELVAGRVFSDCFLFDEAVLEPQFVFEKSARPFSIRLFSEPADEYYNKSAAGRVNYFGSVLGFRFQLAFNSERAAFVGEGADLYYEVIAENFVCGFCGG